MTNNTQIKLAVLETAEWYDGDRVTTVRPLFQLLTQLTWGNANEFRYATFMGKESFQVALRELVSKYGVQYLYIGTHGEKGEICFDPPDEKVNIQSFSPIYNKTTVRGVFFGGCELKELAEKLSKKCKLVSEGAKGRSFPWIAGYGNRIHWIDSTVLDMAFLSLVLPKEKEKQRRINTEEMRGVLSKLVKERGYSGIIQELDFSVYLNGKEVIISN